MEPIDERSDEDDDGDDPAYKAIETLEEIRFMLETAEELATDFQQAIRDVRGDADYLRELLPQLAEHRAEMEAAGWPLERIERLIAGVDTELSEYTDTGDNFSAVPHMILGQQPETEAATG